jgi:hypothetical protein
MSISAGNRSNAASRRFRRRCRWPRFLFEVSIAIAVYHGLYGVLISWAAAGSGNDAVQGCDHGIIDAPRKEERVSQPLHVRVATSAAASHSHVLDTETGRDWNVTSSHEYFDIGVPIRGQDDKLLAFATFLGSSIRKFRDLNGDTTLDFRLLVTRYPDDDTTASFHSKLAEKAYLSLDKVVFAPAVDTQFHRAFAINVLHKHTRQDTNAILAITDVDLQVGPHFFANALNFVSFGTVYFPIVWSQFRPSNVRLVEAVLGPLPKFHEHGGLWRSFGYGIYALSGLDANETLMDESFVGWGGEDNDFYARVQARNMVVRRQNEHDLVHVWHPKYCELGSFVSQKMLYTWYVQVFK